MPQTSAATTDTALNTAASWWLRPVEKIPHVPEKTLNTFKKLAGERAVDLLLHLPTNVIDRRHTSTIADARNAEATTLLVTVESVKLAFRKGRAPNRILVTDDSGTMELVYFGNSSWLTRAYPEGEQVIIHGVVEESKSVTGRKKIMHPDVWPAKRGLENIARLWPKYPATAGLTQGWMTRAIQELLQEAQEQPLPEWLPDDLAEQHKWPNFADALLAMHDPENPKVLDPHHPARVRLAFDEIFINQLILMHARRTAKQQRGIAHGTVDDKQQRFYSNLPFELTADQNTVLSEIDADMSAPQPMLRLIQGDVGSGKTVVALAAIIRCVENGHQGVLMAPTGILAEQHYQAAKKWLEPLGITVALLTGKLTAAEKKRLKEHIRDGFAQVIIGTHALVQEDVIFDNAGLIAIDEQHRFGVRQRLQLTNHDPAPDVLLLTATPIPRTLALSFYGDMDVSAIRSKPPGRQPITTNALPLERLEDVVRNMQRLLDKDEQAYWICPLVDESEKSDLAAASDRAELLQQFYGDKIGLLHGKMKAAEKEETLNRFRDGEIRILVSTTVVEVGVDVPNATAIIIEHAERFGLSQLHQLRGRVGRGSKASSCLLLYDSRIGEYGQARIDAMRQTNDGFDLSEEDLKLRGPGEVLGNRQSGLQVTRLADLSAHKDLMPIAHDHAERILEQGTTPEQRTLLNLLVHLFNKQDAGKLLLAG